MPRAPKLPRVSVADALRYAYDAGFRGDALATAVAIAISESGLQPTVEGDQSLAGGQWGNSVGLWQIRSVVSETGRGTSRDARANMDPAANARAAFAISGGGKNFKPWTMFTNGGYKANLGAVRAELAKSGGEMSLQSTPTPSSSSMSAYYGALSWMLDDPELGPILREANAEHAGDDGWLQARLGETTWYRTHATEQRRYDALTRNPATQADATRELAERAQRIKDAASRLGFTIAEDRANELADRTLRLGLSEPEWLQAVRLEFHYDPSHPGPAASALRQRAAQYAVRLTDDAVRQWSEQIVQGTATEETFDEYLREQAKSLFPSLASAIDAGITVRQYADPYIGVINEELGVPEASVDLTDPKWQRFLVRIDPKSGERVSMNLDDTRAEIRSNPMYGWDNTVRAKNMGNAFTQQLEELMGKTA